MFRRLACWLGVVLLLLLPMALAATDQPKSESQGTDALGDPLPPYALLRIGTVRLRHGVSHLAVAPDGKTVFSAGHDGTIRVWELANGKELRHWQCVDKVRPHTPFDAFALSADGKRLASLDHDQLTIWDPATGRALCTDDHFDVDFFAPRQRMLAFSGDGATLLYHTESTVQLFDAKTAKTLRSFTVETADKPAEILREPPGYRSALAADGSLLVTGNAQGHVGLWDVAQGKELRKLGGDAGNVKAVALSPNNQFYACGNSHGELAIGKTSGEEIRLLTVGEEGWATVEALTFSPNGKQLACGTSRGTVLIVAADNGRELNRIDAHGSRATCLAYTPDGKTLVSGGADGCLRVWDAQTGQEKVTTDDSRGDVTVALTPDGARLATSGCDQAIHVWETATGKKRWSSPREKIFTFALRFSPDGYRLSAYTGSRSRGLRSWNLDSGQERRPVSYPQFIDPWHISPDGRTASQYYLSERNKLGLIDVPTSRQLWTLKREGHPGDALSRDGIVFSPDSKQVGIRWHLDSPDKPDEFRLFAVASGEELSHFPLAAGETPAALTPDKAILITEFGGSRYDLSVERRLSRRLVSNGETLPPFVGDHGYSLYLAVSPDGKTLVVSDEVGPLRLWEIATGRSRGVLQGHRGGVASFAFSADGKRLATGSEDTTALLWDLSAVALAGKPSPKEPTDKELDALWADLLADDATTAYRAIAILAGCPRQSVPYLRTRIQPVPDAVKRVVALIADLDSPQFETRQKAHAELEALSEVAEVPLRAALKDSPSAEVRRHAADLLEKVKTSPYDLSGERLRTWRALEALEQSGTAEACAVLATLAKGDDAARLTREAKLALARLRDRGVPVPHPN